MTTERKPACGPLYVRARDLAMREAVGVPDLIFGAGFVVGQAEKVYSGACKAAMFRPEKEYRGGLKAIIRAAVPVYGLEWGLWDDEFWIFARADWDAVKLAFTHPRNSPAWHRARAALCGIREPDVDERFHERYEVQP